MRVYSGLAGLTAATTLALVLATLSAPTALADDGAPPSPGATASDPADPGASDPGAVDPEAEALAALDEVQDVLGAPATGELTTALAGLGASLSALPTAERRTAERLLARPTDASASTKLLRYPDGAEVFTTCGAQVCLHWTETTQHAPPGSDGNGATVPDWVQTTQQIVEESWSRIVGDLGYRRPVGDGTRGNPAGVTQRDLVDVYLGNIGARGMYGYATLDAASGGKQPGYLVLDDDFAEFALPALSSLKVTAAHEFFHLVQFGYLRSADAWLMEATATWMEEVVYDEVNDNRQYLRLSSLRKTRTPLDRLGFAAYGNWIFFAFLTQRHGVGLIKSLWTRLGRNKTTSLQAIERTLAVKKSSLAAEFVRFASANNAPQRYYSEGKAYPKARVARTATLSRKQRAPGARTVRLDHLTSINHAFRPASRLNRTWRLRVAVRTPSRDVRARVLIHRTDGTVKQRAITIRKGRGALRVAFNTRDVRRVTLTAANTSRAFRCRTGGPWTCQGTPLRDHQPVTLQATLVK